MQRSLYHPIFLTSKQPDCHKVFLENSSAAKPLHENFSQRPLVVKFLGAMQINWELIVIAGDEPISHEQWLGMVLLLIDK